jgi:hypothetical protein
MAPDAEAKKKAARETIDILHEISTLLVRDLRLILSSLARPKTSVLTVKTEHRTRPPISQLLRLSDREWRKSGGSCCKAFRHIYIDGSICCVPY